MVAIHGSSPALFLRRLRLLAAAAALLAGLSTGRAARAEEPGDGDDVLWAGDDAWSDPSQPAEASAATVSANPAAGPAGGPQVQTGTTTVDVGDGYPGTADGNAGGAALQADVETTAPRYQDFQAGLSPYGQWTDTPEYGRVWRPTQVASNWRPYLDGRWVYTRYGWTWVAEEPFGWATYHYGRWWYSPAFGWSWVPGRVWAPAWVSWRCGAGNSGWAPMGPRGVVYVEPTRWVFVQNVHFVQPIRTYAIPVHQTYAVWGQVAPLPVRRPGPTAGPQVLAISRAIGRPIAAVPVAVANSQATATRPSQVGGTLQIFKPAGVPFRHIAAAAAAARTRPDWHQRSPSAAAPSAGQPIVPLQRVQAQPTSPRPQTPPSRLGSDAPRHEARPRPQGGAAERPVPRGDGQPAEQPAHKLRFGGVPSQGIVERNRQQREEQRQRRQEQRPAYQRPSRESSPSPSRPSGGSSSRPPRASPSSTGASSRPSYGSSSSGSTKTSSGSASRPSSSSSSTSKPSSSSSTAQPRVTLPKGSSPQ